MIVLVRVSSCNNLYKSTSYDTNNKLIVLSTGKLSRLPIGQLHFQMLLVDVLPGIVHFEIWKKLDGFFDLRPHIVVHIVSQKNCKIWKSLYSIDSLKVSLEYFHADLQSLKLMAVSFLYLRKQFLSVLNGPLRLSSVVVKAKDDVETLTMEHPLMS